MLDHFVTIYSDIKRSSSNDSKYLTDVDWVEELKTSASLL